MVLKLPSSINLKVALKKRFLSQILVSCSHTRLPLGDCCCQLSALHQLASNGPDEGQMPFPAAEQRKCSEAIQIGLKYASMFACSEHASPDKVAVCCLFCAPPATACLLSILPMSDLVWEKSGRVCQSLKGNIFNITNKSNFSTPYNIYSQRIYIHTHVIIESCCSYHTPAHIFPFNV